MGCITWVLSYIKIVPNVSKWIKIMIRCIQSVNLLNLESESIYNIKNIGTFTHRLLHSILYRSYIWFSGAYITIWFLRTVWTIFWAIFRVKFKLTFTLDSRNSLYFFIFMFYFLCVLLSCVLILSLVHFLLIHLKPFESDVVFERTLGDTAETLDTKRHANRHDAAHYLAQLDIMETQIKLKGALATKSLVYVNSG